MTGTGKRQDSLVTAAHPSAGTPADAVSADLPKQSDDILRLQHDLVKSVLPAGAFVTDDHRYYFNGEGPKPSVTTVLEILDKPALTTWKQQQAVKALFSELKEHPTDLLSGSEDDVVKWALAQVRKTRTDAAAVGSGVHHLADMALRASESDPKAWQVDEGTQPYINAYRAFVDRYSASSFISSEKSVWSLNGYGGTYDLLMMLPTGSIENEGDVPELELWLIDIKTGKGLYPEFALQLAGYRWADYIILPGDPTTYDMPHVDRTGVLHLRPDQYPQGYRLWEYPTSYDTDYMTFLGLLEAYKWRQSQSKPISHKD